MRAVVVVVVYYFYCVVRHIRLDLKFLENKKNSGAGLTQTSRITCRPLIALQRFDTSRLYQMSLKDVMSVVIGRSVRVEITDGRVFVGELQCFDGEMNLIMDKTIEHRSGVEETVGAEGSNSRKVGMVMVPGRHLVKCELEASALDEFDSTVCAALVQSS